MRSRHFPSNVSDFSRSSHVPAKRRNHFKLNSSYSLEPIGQEPALQFPRLRRSRKRLSNGLALLLLLLCLAAALLWVRGRLVIDEIYFNLHSHLLIAGSFPNHLDLIFYRTANYRGPLIEMFPHDKYVPPMPEFWTIRFNGDALKWESSIPWWLFLSFGVAPPIFTIFRRMLRSRNVRQGRCPSCGYDLRATPDRCPECGIIPEIAK
jgi:hypothetical protein